MLSSCRSICYYSLHELCFLSVVIGFLLKNIIQQGDKTSHGGSVLAGDPDVERAIQVYSLFASRLRDKIADDFPE